MPMHQRCTNNTYLKSILCSDFGSGPGAFVTNRKKQYLHRYLSHKKLNGFGDF